MNLSWLKQPIKFELPSERGLRVAFWFLGVIIIARAVYLLRLGWDFNTDDAYITLRYARNLVEGRGISWNAGEAAVEGYSNFLFLIISTFALWLGLDPLIALKATSVVALAGTLLVLFRIGRIWLAPIYALLPLLFLINYHGTILWSVSGLETAVYQFLVAAAVGMLLQAGGIEVFGGSRFSRLTWTLFSSLAVNCPMSSICEAR